MHAPYVRTQSGIPNYFPRAFTYHRVAVYDSATSDLARHAHEIASFVASALHHGSVLVHCRQGVSRGPTAVLFYLIRKLGMTSDEALRLVRSKREVANPIPSFVAQARQCEQQVVHRGGSTTTTTTTGDDQQNKKKNRPRIGPMMGPIVPSSSTTTTTGDGGDGVDETKVHKKKRPRIGPIMGPIVSSSTTTTTSREEKKHTPVAGPLPLAASSSDAKKRRLCDDVPVVVEQSSSPV